MVDEKHIVRWIESTVKVILEKPQSSCTEDQDYDRGCLDTLNHLKKYLLNLKDKDYDVN